MQASIIDCSSVIIVGQRSLALHFLIMLRRSDFCKESILMSWHEWPWIITSFRISHTNQYVLWFADTGLGNISLAGGSILLLSLSSLSPAYFFNFLLIAALRLSTPIVHISNTDIFSCLLCGNKKFKSVSSAKYTIRLISVALKLLCQVNQIDLRDSSCSTKCHMTPSLVAI